MRPHHDEVDVMFRGMADDFRRRVTLRDLCSQPDACRRRRRQQRMQFVRDGLPSFRYLQQPCWIRLRTRRRDCDRENVQNGDVAPEQLCECRAYASTDAENSEKSTGQSILRISVTLFLVICGSP
jgi:hypothetical protein